MDLVNNIYPGHGTMDPHRPVCEIANAKKRMLKHTNNQCLNAKCNMAYLKHVGGASNWGPCLL